MTPFRLALLGLGLYAVMLWIVVGTLVWIALP